jgi:hypothetical protein
VTPDDLYDEREEARYDGPDDREQDERDRYEARTEGSDSDAAA